MLQDATAALSWKSLHGKIALAIYTAPKTYGDPYFHSELPDVHSKIIGYFLRNVLDKPWRDQMALTIAISHAARLDTATIMSRLKIVNQRFTKIFSALSIHAMSEWIPESVFPKYIKGGIIEDDSTETRIRFLAAYNSCVFKQRQWYEGLPLDQQQIYNQFLLPPISSEVRDGLVK